MTAPARRMVTFVVAGDPQPQGSTKAFVVKGRPIITSANTGLRPWKDRMTLTALEAMKSAPGPLSGPISVHCRFSLRRPKSIRRKWHTVRPDLDKLARALGDSLVEAGVIGDDGQIVHWSPWKFYLDDPRSPLSHPGVRVAVIALEPQ